ncbi:MAG: aminotransferase class IV, partial [Bacteroidia bacterium]
QVMWLDARNHEMIEETGTTNIFIRIGDTLITPSTGRNTILEGITRDSILTLAKHWNWKVEIRDIGIHELFEAYRAGTLKEVFAAGTAATIAQIEVIHYEGEEIRLGGLASWEWSHLLKNTMEQIKTSQITDDFEWMTKI